MCACGGCEDAVTARTRCEWVMFLECGELLYGRRFLLKLMEALCKSYVAPTALYGSEAWCLKGSQLKIFCWTEISTVRVMCGVQLRDRKR